MSRRKPSWLKDLCPEMCNTARLKPHRCAGCGEWTVIYTGGPVEETYDPRILTYGRNLTTALLLGRNLTRIVQIGDTQLFHLQDVCGARGIRSDGLYLSAHVCHATPISVKPFHTRQRTRAKPWTDGPTLSTQEIKEFERLWKEPLWA